MRWTKGKPIDEAPCGVPVLVVYYSEDRPPSYAILIRSRGAWTRGESGIERQTYQWAYAHDGRMATAWPGMRFWLLPGREYA